MQVKQNFNSFKLALTLLQPIILTLSGENEGAVEKGETAVIKDIYRFRGFTKCKEKLAGGNLELFTPLNKSRD